MVLNVFFISVFFLAARPHLQAAKAALSHLASGIVLSLNGSVAADVPDFDTSAHEGPRDEQPSMAVRWILLRAKKADAEARDALEQPRDAALLELPLLDAVVVEPCLARSDCGR